MPRKWPVIARARGEFDTEYKRRYRPAAGQYARKAREAVDVGGSSLFTRSPVKLMRHQIKSGRVIGGR